MLSLSTLVPLALVSFILFRLWKSSKRIPNLPPGPPSDPIVGHLRVLGDEHLEEKYHELAETYGDVVHLNVLGKDFVILSSEEAARELLEKQGAINSNRPHFHFFTNTDWKDALVFIQYGEPFIRQRRIIQGAFTNQKVSDYNDIEEVEINTMLKKLLDRPADYVKHLHLMTASILVSLTFGHRITEEDDEHLKIVEEITALLSEGRRVAMMDLFPILQRVPEWIQRFFVPSLSDAKNRTRYMMDFPFNTVVEEMAAGKAIPSLVSQQLDKLDSNGKRTPEAMADVRTVAHMILAGGTETTWSTVVIFIALMTLNPEAQKKAQEEIDRVVGSSRLPDITDRSSLPYVNAMLLELLRWHPVVPGGVAHQSVADNEYRGMFIPKGTTLIPNARTMAFNEKVYKDARKFKPERFLDTPEREPEPFSTHIVFGFGRRKCPGQYLADSVVWLTMARILATYSITTAKDKNGNPVEQKFNFHGTGLVSYPEPFKCDIVPRSKAAETLLRGL